MVETRFVNLAMSIGVPEKIASLSVDCDKAIAAFTPDDDRRWYWRLEHQRRLLLNPTLRAVVALTARVVEETPGLAPKAVSYTHLTLPTIPLV